MQELPKLEAILNLAIRNDNNSSIKCFCCGCTVDTIYGVCPRCGTVLIWTWEACHDNESNA